MEENCVGGQTHTHPQSNISSFPFFPSLELQVTEVDERKGEGKDNGGSGCIKTRKEVSRKRGEEKEKWVEGDDE